MEQAQQGKEPQKDVFSSDVQPQPDPWGALTRGGGTQSVSPRDLSGFIGLSMVLGSRYPDFLGTCIQASVLAHPAVRFWTCLHTGCSDTPKS